MSPEAGWNKRDVPKGPDLSRNLTIGLGIVLGLSILGWIFILISRGDTIVPVTTVTQGGNETLPEHSVSDFMENSSPEEVSDSARQAVAGFLNARTLKGRCQFIHGGESHLEKMRQFYARIGESDQPSGFSKIAFERLESMEGVPFIYLNALDASGETHVFNLLPTSDGMLIDWESSVCYGEMTWEEFQEKKPEEPVLMRVLLSSRHSEDDEGTPLDFVLLSERDDRSLRIVYVDPDGEVSRTLKDVFKTGASFYPYTLYVTWNTERRVAEVTGLKHLYWMDPKLSR